MKPLVRLTEQGIAIIMLGHIMRGDDATAAH